MLASRVSTRQHPIFDMRGLRITLPKIRPHCIVFRITPIIRKRFITHTMSHTRTRPVCYHPPAAPAARCGSAGSRRPARASATARRPVLDAAALCQGCRCRAGLRESVPDRRVGRRYGVRRVTASRVATDLQFCKGGPQSNARYCDVHSSFRRRISPLHGPPFSRYAVARFFSSPMTETP